MSESGATTTIPEAPEGEAPAKPLTSADLFAALRQRLGEAAIVEHVEGVGDPAVFVAPDRWLEVATVLRNEPEFAFDFCSNVTGVDWPEQDILESVVHLYSMTHHHHLTVKMRLPRAKPEVASVAGVWPAADWHEREQYDMLGIVYVGHPNLRRILLAEDWEGFPLRKDYVAPDEIHGVSNLP